MEDKFCEIVEALLDYQAEAKSNENCGPLGNDEVGLYRARDLARKYGFKKVLEMCSFGDNDEMTAEEYSTERNRKLGVLRKEAEEKKLLVNNLKY